MEEERYTSRLETGRARRAEQERRRVKKVLVVCLALMVVAALSFYLLGPYRPFGESDATNRSSVGEDVWWLFYTAVPAVTLPVDTGNAEIAGREPVVETGDPVAEVEEAVGDGMYMPLEGVPILPFTEAEAIACVEWTTEPMDYPYFGAPRESSRTHAGVDIYPAAGEGAPVRAMKDGTVLKVETFFVRYTGEQTYAMLIDHGDFVANYAELRPPALRPGDTVSPGEIIGHLSGTEQLHFEMYTPGTTSWAPWYGEKPANLIDPTGTMLELFGLN